LRSYGLGAELDYLPALSINHRRLFGYRGLLRLQCAFLRSELLFVSLQLFGDLFYSLFEGVILCFSWSEPKTRQNNQTAKSDKTSAPDIGPTALRPHEAPKVQIHQMLSQKLPKKTSVGGNFQPKRAVSAPL
jgi:hypothetical protein